MKAFYLVFGILTQLFLTGCEKIGGLGDIVMDSGIDFLCEDELKNDLFSKSSTNTLNTDNIRIYYVNGIKKLMYLIMIEIFKGIIRFMNSVQEM